MTTSLSTWQSRRQRLIQALKNLGGGIAVLPSNGEIARNSTNTYAFRQDSHFLYLTGFNEPEAILLLVALPDHEASILFCRDKDPQMETWEGFRYGPDAAKDVFAFDRCHSINEWQTILSQWLVLAPQLFAPTSNLSYAQSQFHAELADCIKNVEQKSRSGTRTPDLTRDLKVLIDAMRLIKDSDEIALMQRAADIAASGHKRAMRYTRPGCKEFEIEAELRHEFQRLGARHVAYEPIVASGKNACILHYIQNSDTVKPSDLILIDAGCEYQGYASDITRCFPASGRFSGPQRDLYELVLSSQKAALNCVAPGSSYMAPHEAVVNVLAQGLLDLGLLDKNAVGSVDDIVAQQAYKQFYMHSTSHWLGLDVHDVGSYRTPDAPCNEVGIRPWRVLESGMVLTIEPGLYVSPGKGIPEAFWNIGIRIEDDVLVTDQGHHIFSSAAPKEMNDIENLMKN